MASLFSSPSPEDTVKARKSMLEEYTNLVPAQASEQKYQRDKLKQQVMSEVGKAPQKQQEGGIESAGLMGLGTLGVLQKGVTTGAQLMPKQRQEMDQLKLGGAMQQQDIAKSKTEQATTNTIRGIEDETQKLARLVADRAFEAGMSAKQLILSESNALADYSFEKLKEDYQAGRVSKKEIRDLTNKFLLDAQTKKAKAEQAIKLWQESFAADMEKGNVERSKSRTLAAQEASKEALIAAAKAQATAKVIEGATGVVSAVLPEPFGGVVEGLSKIIPNI